MHQQLVVPGRGISGPPEPHNRSMASMHHRRPSDSTWNSILQQVGSSEEPLDSSVPSKPKTTNSNSENRQVCQVQGQRGMLVCWQSPCRAATPQSTPPHHSLRHCTPTYVGYSNARRGVGAQVLIPRIQASANARSQQNAPA